jgi:peptide/nickel transport system substrate-binding protein
MSWFKAVHSKWLIAALVLALVGAFVGAGSAQQAQTDVTTFVYDTFGQQQTLDPVWEFDTASGIVTEHMYDTLIYYEGTSTDNLVPIVAAEFPKIGPVNPDNTQTYSFKIRSGITFHNGDPLTAADVQYSFLRLLITDRDGGSGFIFNPELLGATATRDDKGNLQTDLIDRICGNKDKNIQQAVTVEGNNVTFHLVQPFGPFLQALATGEAGIVDKNFVISKGGWPGCTGNRDTDIANFKKYNNPPNQSNTELFNADGGSGPYALQSWDQTNKITTLKAYPSYWQGDPAKQSFATILIKTIDSDAARILDLKNGQADFIDPGTNANLPTIYGTPGTRTLPNLPSLVSQVICFNFGIKQPGGSNVLMGSGKLNGEGIPPEFFQDIHVRKAFNYLFDQSLAITRAYKGLAIPIATPHVQGLNFYNPEQQGVNAAGGIAGNGADLNKAADEFKLAFGGTADKPGPVWTNGFVFTASYNSGNLNRQIWLNLLQANLQALNNQAVFGKHGSFSMAIRNPPFAQLLNEIVDGTLPLHTCGWAPDYIDAADYLLQWMGSRALGSAYSGTDNIDQLPAWNTPGTTLGGTPYKTWDDILLQGSTSGDLAVRKDAYYTLQKLYVEKAVEITVAQPSQPEVLRNWLNNYSYNVADPGSTLGPLFNPASKRIISKVAQGDGKDDPSICATFSTVVTVVGGNPPVATDCNGKAVSPIPGS